MPHRSQSPLAVGLIAALARELTPWLQGEPHRRLPGHLPAWRLPRPEGVVVALVSGMGPGAADKAARCLAGEHHVNGLLSVGFGGALTPEIPPGALILSQECWTYDPETCTSVRQAMDQNSELLGRLLTLLRSAGLPAYLGAAVTAPGIIAKAVHAPFLTHLSRPVLDLESAAVAAVARESGLLFLGLRAVTDTAHEEIPAFLARHLNEYRQPTVPQVLRAVAAKPRRLPRVAALGGRARLAARRLAAALRQLLPELLRHRPGHFRP